MTRRGCSQMRAVQEGVTLIVSMILLILVTLVVVSAFNLTSTDLKSVFNLQSRTAAVAAADQAMERVISSNFYDQADSQPLEVDMDADGKTDFTVNVAKPRCIKAVQAAPGGPSDLDPVPINSGGTWFTDWDIDAEVTDAVSGAKVQVKQGVRVLLSDAKKTITCPTPTSPS